MSLNTNGNINTPTCTATSSQYLITNGTGTYNWKTLDSPTNLMVTGDAEFEGDVKIQGKSIAETLEKIEQRLAMLHPNEKLEEKWEKLKELGEQYRELEKELIHSEEMWKILKK